MISALFCNGNICYTAGEEGRSVDPEKAIPLALTYTRGFFFLMNQISQQSRFFLSELVRQDATDSVAIPRHCGKASCKYRAGVQRMGLPLPLITDWGAQLSSRHIEKLGRFHSIARQSNAMRRSLFSAREREERKIGTLMAGRGHSGHSATIPLRQKRPVVSCRTSP